MVEEEQISFEFGDGVRLSLPKRKEDMKKKIIEYLSQDEDLSNFEKNLENALKNAGSNRPKLEEEMSKALEDALKDNELSLQAYKADTKAWSEYLIGQDKQTRIERAKQISLFDAFTDSKKYFELVGTTSLELGRDLENLPDLDIDTFLQQEDLNPVYIEENGKITFTASIGKFSKKVAKVVDSALEKNPDEVRSTLLKDPVFLSGFPTIKYKISVDTRAKEHLIGEIPEMPTNLSSFSSKLTDYYVDYIRRELGIASGGFVPYGQTYTRTTKPSKFSSRQAETKIKFQNTDEKTFNFDYSKKFNIDTAFILDEVFENLEDLKSEEIIIYSEDITDDIMIDIKKLEYLNNLLDSLENLKELKVYELNFNVLIPNVDNKEFKTAIFQSNLNDGNDSETDSLLNAPLKNIRVKSLLRTAMIGNYDFSYYSKAGEIKKDKMNDHLNEIRTKIIGLGYDGVEGGI